MPVHNDNEGVGEAPNLYPPSRRMQGSGGRDDGCPDTGFGLEAMANAMASGKATIPTAGPEPASSKKPPADVAGKRGQQTGTKRREIKGWMPER